MRKRQTAVLEALRAVQGFLDKHAGEVAPVNESGARVKVNDCVVDLTVQAADQSAGRTGGKSETVRYRELRRQLLVRHMRPIALVAKARLRDVPEISVLQVPQQGLSATVLVARATDMAEGAAKYASTFIESGLPQDFVAQLTTAATALSAALDERSQSVSRFAGATNALKALEKEGMNALRVIDSLVTPILGLNDRLLGEWRSVKVVRRKRGGAPQATTVPPAAAAVPSPTAPTAATEEVAAV